ncbi:MAG: flagellar biosynthesis anti-sigma factor FlgM [Desulfovibrionaceae bacterium]
MNIYFNPNQSINPYQTDRSQEARQARVQSHSQGQEIDAGPKGDRVSVSQHATLLTEARRTAQATPDVRQEKVDALKEQVANGTYQINTTQLATNLLSEESALFKF